MKFTIVFIIAIVSWLMLYIYDYSLEYYTTLPAIMIYAALSIKYPNWHGGFAGERYHAKVVDILDGDTLILGDNVHRENIKYRIQYIDTPELSQKHGQEAAAVLASLLKFKFIEYSVPSSGRRTTHDRTLCTLYANGEDVGLKMIELGMAWIDTQYYVPPNYIRAFADARGTKAGAGVGIFKLKNPKHPNLYRHSKKD